MSAIKKLAGHTAIYGASTIVARLINYFLTPLYLSASFGFEKAEYGVISDWYSVVAFVTVFITFGMETTFFRFAHKTKQPEKVFNNGLTFLIGINLLFLILVILFQDRINEIMGYSSAPQYLIIFSIILVLDAISSLPMARLRYQSKARKFALINVSNIGVNVIMNIILLMIFRKLFFPEWGVIVVFVANLIASIVKLLLLKNELKTFRFGFENSFIKPMLKFAYPMIFIGLAGIVNEMLDRQMIKYVLKEQIGLNGALEQLGIYSANYKLAVLITLFIQAFRYAAEPFFFAQSDSKDRDRIYSRVLTYFVIATCGMFLVMVLYLDVVKYLIIPNKAYWEGLKIVWIVLLANIFLGIYTNLSIWYKLSDKVKMGAYIANGGAVITIGLNLILLPKIGYIGAAWATLACYLFMTLTSYYLGQKHYPIKYNVKKVSFYIAISLVLFGFSELIYSSSLYLNLIIGTFLLVMYGLIVKRIEKIEVDIPKMISSIKTRLGK